MDRLSPFFNRFTPSAKVFYSGSMCQASHFDESDGVGHLHLLRSGTLRIDGKTIKERLIQEPSILFSPKPQSHTLAPAHTSGADMVCATIDFGSGSHNPFVQTLPDLMIIPFSEAPDLLSRIEWLFEEALGDACGRDAALDLLTEYVLIMLLRFGMNHPGTSGCILTGLSDERLAHTINAIHERPEESWTLETLAATANMSRARFAHNFRETVGVTPLDYLTDWRLSIAQPLLRGGDAVGTVAQQVGYQNATSFSRAFSRKTGLTPRDWLKQ